MNSHTKTTNRESFSVVTISREDVNYALGLALDHEFGIGLDRFQMTQIAARCRDSLNELWDWDILGDVLDVLSISVVNKVDHENPE